jgi:hypothetical protein
MNLRNLYRALLRLRIKVAQAEEIAARIKLARTEHRKS